MEMWKFFTDDNNDFEKYQTLAQRTSSKKPTKMKQLENGLMGMAEEAGEALGVLKKHYFQGHELNVDKIIEEMGDVLWYIAETCSALDITMQEVANQNINKLIERYPKGFEKEKSINRKEYINE